MSHHAGGMKQSGLGIGGVGPPDKAAMEDVEPLLVASESNDIAVTETFVCLVNTPFWYVPSGLCREAFFDPTEAVGQGLAGCQLRIEIAMGGHEVDVTSLALGLWQ